MKFFLPLFLFFFVINSPVISDQKIVFVDMDRLVSVSKPGSSIFKQLKDINNKNLIFLKNEEKKFKEKEKKLIAQKNIITEADFKNKVDKMKSQIDNYNQDRKKMIEEFNKLKVENINNLLNQINPILAKYSKQNEISIILKKKDLIIGKSELDITEEIIKIIDNEIKEYKIK
jgi:Skp family chaperone for outer membrane proteins